MTSDNQAKPRRITIPFLIDVVLVSAADHILKIEESDAIDRLHSFNTTQLPGWVKFYFRATKFHDAERDLWFSPLEPASTPDYAKRLAYIEEKVNLGYSAEDVQHIASLLQNDAADDELSHAMVQVVNKRFFGAEIPHEICQAAGDTLKSLGDSLNPGKYKRGREGQKTVMAYCEHHLPKDVHILDIGHNIGEVVQVTTGALRALKANLDQSVETTFTKTHTLTEQVPRIAVKASTLGGLLSKPTTPGKTVFIYKISKAAAETGDLNFTFGSGSDDRQCVFRDFFMNFMTDVQQALKETAPA